LSEKRVAGLTTLFCPGNIKKGCRWKNALAPARLKSHGRRIKLRTIMTGVFNMADTFRVSRDWRLPGGKS